MPPRRRQPGIQIRSFDGLAGDDANGSYWGTASVLVKPDTPEAPNGVAAEFLSTRLANAVGIPVPMGDVALDFRNRVVWVSALVQLDGEELAPPDPTEVVARSPDIAAGIFVFDVWTLNGDRHDENFVYHSQVGLWAFDHALGVGQLYQSSFANLQQEINRPLTFHELRSEALQPARLHQWGERIRGLSRTAIERSILEAQQRGLITVEDRAGITELLLQRQTNIHRLVQRSLPQKADKSEPGAEAMETEGGVLE